MKRFLSALLALVALVSVGCSAGSSAKVSSPETKFDFGDVPVTADVQKHDFVIKNDGTADLKITGVQVKLLKGC